MDWRGYQLQDHCMISDVKGCKGFPSRQRFHQAERRNEKNVVRQAAHNMMLLNGILSISFIHICFNCFNVRSWRN